MDYIIRKMAVREYPLLNDFLYEAIFVPEGTKPLPRAIISSPELQVYIKHFGTLDDDFALVAESHAQIVGAVWVRIMNDYGHVDDKTPSLALSLYKEYRGQGIGTQLLTEMLSFLKKHGYSQVSLSVQKANYAVRLYKKAGFKILHEREEELIMVCDLKTTGFI